MVFINIDFIWNLGVSNILIILTFFSFTNGLFLIPASQVILIFGGLVVGKGSANFFFVFSILVLSNFIGNYLLYFISFKWGEAAARKILPLKKKTLDNNIIIINYLFHKYGHYIIFIGRNLPIVHSLVSIPAGVAKVPRRKFIIYTLLGICTWALIFMGIGIFLGNNYEYFVKQIGIATIILTIVMLGLTYCFFETYLKKILIKAKKEKLNIKQKIS